MSADDTRKQTRETTTPERPRKSAEEWVEQVATYWGRCFVLAWRTVFPPKEDHR